MRVVVLGSTGPTGRELTAQALAAGFEVTAVARRPEAVQPREGLRVVRADVTVPGALDEAVAGADAVVSALGAPPGRGPVEVYSAGARNTVAAMERHEVKRLVVVSSSVLDPAWRPSGEFFFNRVLDPYVNRKVAGRAHEDMRRMEAVVRASALDWTIARPSGLFDHPVVTGPLVAEGSADVLFTARADLAAAMLRELAEGRFTGRAMGVGTTAFRPGIARVAWSEARRAR